MHSAVLTYGRRKLRCKTASVVAAAAAAVVAFHQPADLPRQVI